MRLVIQHLFLVFSLLLGSYQGKASVCDTKPELSIARLLDDYFQSEGEEKWQAFMEISRKGRDDQKATIAALIHEMNQPKYVSSEPFLDKMRDPKWGKRMAIARMIEDLSDVDFSVRTSAHGWDPDISFTQINEWWSKIKASEKENLENE